MSIRSLATVLGVVAALVAAGAAAEPIDFWNTTGPGYECTADPYNPIRPDGTRDPHGDPAPGEPAWDARDAEHVACTDQRDHDTRSQPLRGTSAPLYGQDPYRLPERHDGVRFRYDSFTQLDIPDVPSTEIYRPCPSDPGICPDLPPGLSRFDPPYPVVVVFHGFIADKSQHRYTSQMLAEAGYMAIAVNGTNSGGTSTPNVQRAQNGDDVLRWLAGESTDLLGQSIDPGVYGDEADLDRVAFAGHSQGAGVSLGYQGDPRIHAIIAWDGGDSISDQNCTVDPLTGERSPCAPIMYQRTDGGFATPRDDRDDYPYEDDSATFGGPRDRGRPPYEAHVERDMDVFHFTARATVHTDWNGNGSGLTGNRYAELLINYYSLAWLDRHLRGKLVFDAAGNVRSDHGRSEAEERAFRQAIAEDAFERLTAHTFDASVDVHNVSMGFWDPDLAVQNLDPVYGGNVPVRIEGLETRDRFSPYYYHYCSVTVPDYVGGGSGEPGDGVPALRAAATGPEGDMRFVGCPELD